MHTPTLSTVYLDNERIGLMGDPKPLVSKIVAAGGKVPEAVQVLRGKSAADKHGHPLRLWDTVDRTAEPAKPIYLTCKPRPAGPSVDTSDSPSAVGGRTMPPQPVSLPDGPKRLPSPRPPLPEPRDPDQPLRHGRPDPEGEAWRDP